MMQVCRGMLGPAESAARQNLLQRHRDLHILPSTHGLLPSESWKLLLFLSDCIVYALHSHAQTPDVDLFGTSKVLFFHILANWTCLFWFHVSATCKVLERAVTLHDPSLSSKS